MARLLIGNIKGPQGAQGIQGPQGPVGPTGPQGPMPDLINNALATQAGVAALDAVMGKTLQDQITQQNSNLTYSYNEVVHNGVTWYVHTLRLKDIQIISATGAISCEGCSNVWGSVYASDTIYANFTYPNPFAELPSIHLNFVPSGANAWPMMTLDGSKTNGPNVQLIRGTTYSAFSGRLSMLMIGRAG